MEHVLKLVGEALDCQENEIKSNMSFEDHDQWDSLSAIVLHESLIEHYNLEIPIENLGEYSVKSIEDLL